jgi:hypothetical protein
LNFDLTLILVVLTSFFLSQCKSQPTHQSEIREFISKQNKEDLKSHPHPYVLTVNHLMPLSIRVLKELYPKLKSRSNILFKVGIYNYDINQHQYVDLINQLEIPDTDIINLVSNDRSNSYDKDLAYFGDIHFPTLFRPAFNGLAWSEQAAFGYQPPEVYLSFVERSKSYEDCQKTKKSKEKCENPYWQFSTSKPETFVFPADRSGCDTPLEQVAKILEVDNAFWVHGSHDGRYLFASNPFRFFDVINNSYPGGESLQADPFLTPDGRFITYPTPMRFYRFEPFSTEKDPKPVFEDSDWEDAYQSVGLVSKTEDLTTYRVISAFNTTSGKVRELTFDNQDKLVKSTPVAWLCENLYPCKGDEALCFAMQLTSLFQFSLPILSADGRFFGTYDRRDGQSKIMKIIKKQDTSGRIYFDCETSNLIPYFVSKMNFNIDASKAAFHLKTVNMGYRGFWFDRSSGNYKPLVNKFLSDKSVWYPSFIGNDTLLIPYTKENKSFAALVPLDDFPYCYDDLEVIARRQFN